MEYRFVYKCKYSERLKLLGLFKGRVLRAEHVSETGEYYTSDRRVIDDEEFFVAAYHTEAA